MENEEHTIDNAPRLSLLLDEINKLLLTMAESKNVDQADQYFDLLAIAQKFVAKTIMSDQIEVPDGLWKFFKDFDRIDTQVQRNYILNEIKYGHYTLPSMQSCKNDKIKLVLNKKTDLYSIKDVSSFQSLLLAHFLVDDIGCTGIYDWKKTINNPSKTWLEGEYIYLTKTNGNILLGKKNELNANDAKVFTTNSKQLNYILDCWQKACEEKPNNILITLDKDQLTIDFKN